MRCRPSHILVALLFVHASLTGSAAETLRVRADQWMPFNGEPESQQPGYVVELLRRIFEPQGITIEYRVMPWGEALKAAADGTADAVIGANRNEAAALVVPSEPIGNPRVGLFVVNGNTWKYQNLRSLLEIRLGVLVDYKYWDSLDDYIQKHDAPQVVKFTGDAPLRDAIVQLKAGKIDVLPETVPAFVWTVRAAGLKYEDFHPAYLHEGEMIFVAFTPQEKKGQRFAQLFDAGIRALRKSGELAALLERYGQKDWQQP